ncbi:MAG: M28 family peptidase, partial [Thermoplasmatota archaeon]
NTEVLVTGVNNSGWWIVNYTIKVNQRYPELLNFTIIQDDPLRYGSDHKSFLKYGFDAIYISEATEDTDYHKPSDTLKNMDVSYTKEVTRLVLATVAEMAWNVEYE